MKTTLRVDAELLSRAAELTNVTDNSALVRMALEALIIVESTTRLARLGGSEADLEPVERRRLSE